MKSRFSRRRLGTAVKAGTAAAAMLTAAACGNSAEGDSSSEESIEFDYAQYGAPSNAQTINSMNFADSVREATDGRVDITVRPLGELPFAPTEYLRRVGDGSVAMAEALGGFIAGDCPVATLSGFPFLVENAQEHKTMWPEFVPFVEDCVEGANARILWSFGFPSVQIFGSGDAPESLDDLAGLSIRQLGPESTEWLEELGVEPVTLTTDEVATAMQRGVIDGFITSADTTNTIWAELADWVYVVNLGVTPQYAMMNLDDYNSLPGGLKSSFDEVAAEWQSRSTDFFAQRDADAMKSLEEEHGYTIVTPTQEDLDRAKAIAQEKWEEWAVGLADDQGLAALDAVRSALGK